MGIENGTWDTVGTKFDLIKATRGKKGLIYPQIIQGFNYPPEIDLKEFQHEGRRVYVLRVKTCGDAPFAFAGKPYIRNGEVNDELVNHPAILKSIVNKVNDWSAQVPSDVPADWYDEAALARLTDVYFQIPENRSKKLSPTQLLNALSLVDEYGKPNHVGLLFIGKLELRRKIFGDRNKLTWVYRDTRNGIEERVSVDDENLPLIFAIPNILDKINKFNTTLQDIDLFRNDVLQYDKNTIEEIMVNAIVHRDWNINLWIEVVQTPTSLEIRNPGNFRADLYKVLMENRRPEYLNPTLTDFAKKIHLMEKEGGGLKKAFTAQIRKGLNIRLRTSSVNTEESSQRVDFILTGKVQDVDFARFMFTERSLSEEQVVILDRINSGQNKMGVNIDNNEYILVKDLVIKSGRGAMYLKIKEHLLKKSKKYIDNFANTHIGQSASRSTILDYAKGNSPFTTDEIYRLMAGKNRVWVRKLLMEMVNNGELERISRGKYVFVPKERTKQIQDEK